MTIKIGDKVKYMGRKVTVAGIEFMPIPSVTKLKTVPIEEIDIELKGLCVFTFSDFNKWAWGDQIEPLITYKKVREMVENTVTNILKENEYYGM